MIIAIHFYQFFMTVKWSSVQELNIFSHAGCLLVTQSDQPEADQHLLQFTSVGEPSSTFIGIHRTVNEMNTKLFYREK
jgi:hypothetical protein